MSFDQSGCAAPPEAGRLKQTKQARSTATAGKARRTETCYLGLPQRASRGQVPLAAIERERNSQPPAELARRLDLLSASDPPRGNRGEWNADRRQLDAVTPGDGPYLSVNERDDRLAAFRLACLRHRLPGRTETLELSLENRLGVSACRCPDAVPYVLRRGFAQPLTEVSCAARHTGHEGYSLSSGSPPSCASSRRPCPSLKSGGLG